ncbi:MAG: ArsC/Spx/MgsR family protein [Bacteroidota bacterium]
MKKIYYLSTCDTCKKIMSAFNLTNEFIRQDLKTEPINSNQLNQLYSMAGSYESLFNKRARLYKERDLKNKQLSESDFRELLLEHYTFLKRPIFIIGDDIFVGNSKATVAALASAIDHE